MVVDRLFFCRKLNELSLRLIRANTSVLSRKELHKHKLKASLILISKSANLLSTVDYWKGVVNFSSSSWQGFGEVMICSFGVGQSTLAHHLPPDLPDKTWPGSMIDVYTPAPVTTLWPHFDPISVCDGCSDPGGETLPRSSPRPRCCSSWKKKRVSETPNISQLEIFAPIFSNALYYFPQCLERILVRVVEGNIHRSQWKERHEKVNCCMMRNLFLPTDFFLSSSKLV